MVTDIISVDILVQLLGACGYITYAVGGALRSRFAGLSFEFFGCVIVALQWVLLDADYLAYANFIFAYAVLTGIAVEHFKQVKFLSWFSIPAMILLVLTSGDHLVYAVFVSLISAIGLFSKSVVSNISRRVLSIVCAVCWVGINAFSGSIPGVVFMSGYCIAHSWRLFKTVNEDEAVKALSPSSIKV